MADPVPEKIQKLFDNRLEAGTELEKNQYEIIDAVNNSDRRVRVERLVTYCDEFMSKAFSKNEQLLELAKITNDPASTSADLKKWFHETTANNDEILKKARDYIDEHLQSEKLSQNSRKITTSRTKSNKVSSSKTPKTSSQPKRLAKQKQELELGRQYLELEKKEGRTKTTPKTSGTTSQGTRVESSGTRRRKPKATS